MELVEVTWDKALRIWWSYFWRVLVFSLLLVSILAIVGAVIFFSLGMPEVGRKYGVIIAQLSTIPVSIWVFKKILRKRFNGYSVALIENDNA